VAINVRHGTTLKEAASTLNSFGTDAEERMISACTGQPFHWLSV
jgi:hypothetical protein